MSSQRQLMGDQIVDVDLAAPCTSRRSSARRCGPRAPPKAVPFHTRPVTSWNGPGGDFLTRAGDADDDADAPAPVAAFERLAHRLDIADALEAVIGAALGQVHEIGDEITLDLLRVDEMGHPEFLGERPPLRVEVDADDHVGADHTGSPG